MMPKSEDFEKAIEGTKRLKNTYDLAALSALTFGFFGRRALSSLNKENKDDPYRSLKSYAILMAIAGVVGSGFHRWHSDTNTAFLKGFLVYAGLTGAGALVADGYGCAKSCFTP